MKKYYVDWNTGKIETYYRGARTTRFVQHMRRESVDRLWNEINDLLTKGYSPRKHEGGWLYTRGAA